MNPSRRQFLQATVAGVAGLLPLGVTGAVSARANPSGTTAIRAGDFLKTLGVCSSITGRGETLTGTIDALRYTGIRWIRCGLEDRISVKDMIDLHKQTGAKIAYGLLSGGTDLARLLDEARQLASAGALLAIEGNNEPNNWGITYQGEAGGRNLSWLPVARLQRDLYEGVKSDPVLKDYPVWSISGSGAQTDNVGLQFLTIPGGAGTLMPDGTVYADFANCHNYITHPSWRGLHDNQTWLSASPGSDCPVDGLYKNYGRTWRHRFAGYSEAELLTLPRVTTETGCPVEGDVTEEIQARLFLNLYLSQFKRGWSHTAIYLLRTRSNEPAHHIYAMYTIDYTAKQAAHYLHHLTTILADSGSARTLGRIDYSILNQPATVHDLLLQKSDGTFALVLWGERFAGGSDRITVNLGTSCATINVYDPTVGTSPRQSLTDTREVALTLTNHPVVLEIKG
ncbi:MAG: glycosyl hydrolase [Planctomycetaceae bacterium]|nr:MAG: glycosyl hydrolase [Planctomycetaceae bacterium]